ncbi:Mitochondrial FoF1-type ATP synthase assembly chaperone ATP12 (Atp12) (PDB:2P4X) [Commensalibacter communis]|uniref:ATP12 family chaperone protein n=1 Tax=Commensalibacter communis TaxID=2972786 RepID=UPI0022FF9FAC|nr:ATP12 family protein [Commensalibacter communis]CAI3923577.1 Mitochondrial FoF1-type ATP synthase assembly chaperone ATP12 (Atp12) (PDB:2P4X) [Commensalibacter communis]CAI3935602.1 Mitochondrial FoF1-type ATP synthase assembly chaperone ATP12 (Atp12) (PDB:2P4X) [Commensalibacter communis]
MAAVSKLRRFWKSVNIIHNDKGYQILLDERPVKLPQKTELYVQSPLLAEKIADEWKNISGQKEDYFSFNDLPMTQITATMIEKISPTHDIYIDALLPYVSGDLLCYFADQPKKLVIQQQEKWIPLIHWIEKTFQTKLKTTQGIMPIVQEPKVTNLFKSYLSNLDSVELTYFAIIVPLLGSMILSIALKDGRITVQEAFNLAYLDEIIQAEIWGHDTEQQAKLDKIQIDIQDAYNFYCFAQNI